MVLHVIQRVEGLGHVIFVDNYVTSPLLFDDLCQCKIGVYRTFRHDRCGVPQDIRPKSLKMKRGSIMTKVSGNVRGSSLERQAGYVHSDKCALCPPLKAILLTHLAMLSNLGRRRL